MTSEELWDECVGLYESAPLQGSCCEMSWDKYGELKRNMIMTLKYWSDPKTIGGSFLQENFDLLSDEAKIIFNNKEL